MPDTVLEAALQIAVGGPTAVAVNLVGQIEAWRHQAAELQAAENWLHSLMPHRRAKAFRVKAFAVVQTHAPVADESAAGFNITAHVPVSGVFEVRTADNEVQEHSREWLWRRAGDVRRTLAENSKAGTGTDEALAQEVYDKTMKEVSNEWASGSHSPEEWTAILGPRWVHSRRFGIVHVNNTAFVDDFAECLVHRAVSCPEKVSVDVVDRVAGHGQHVVSTAEL